VCAVAAVFVARKKVEASMEDSVSSHFQAPGRDLKVRCAAEYFFTKLRGVWKCGKALAHVFTLIYLLDQN